MKDIHYYYIAKVFPTACGQWRPKFEDTSFVDIGVIHPVVQASANLRWQVSKAIDEIKDHLK